MYKTFFRQHFFNFQKVFISAGIRTRDLWIRSPTRYPLRYRDLVVKTGTALSENLEEIYSKM